MKHPVRLALAFLLTPIALALQLWAAKHTTEIEQVYSRKIYPLFAAFFSTVFGAVPFPVIGILLILVAVISITRLIFRIHKAGRSGLLHGLLHFASFLSVLFFLFTILWQLNYNRLPLAENLGYKTASPSTAELIAVTAGEISAINALCPQLSWDNQGHSYDSSGFASMASRINDTYGRFSASQPLGKSFFSNVPAYPKQVSPKGLLASFSIQGVYVAFTFEPLVDTSYPMFMWPFVIAHESAHLKGFAREDEANHLAYLADCQNPDIFTQYSAHMNALLYLSSALGSTNSSVLNAQLQTLDPRAKADIDHYNTYVAKHHGIFSKTGEKVNSTYLQAQGQKGTRSYNGFVNLLCDRYRTTGAT